MTDVDATPATHIRVAWPAPGPASRSGSGPLAGVALVTIDRPDALNALSFDLLRELASALEALDADPACRVIVLTGAGSRAFAAGADIRELATQTSASLAAGHEFDAWGRIDAIGLPLIAAVRGFALGGGCELAMACDMHHRRGRCAFGQPEIRPGGHARCRRHATADPGDRPGPGHGDDPDRPDDRRR